MARLLAALLLAVVAGCSTAPAPPASPSGPLGARIGPAAPTGSTETARVLTIVDGDTIRVDRGNGSERVRYIGIDTPETRQPGDSIEFMGEEATEANRALVEGREVFLERDVSETDRFGRLLRYVWIRDGDGWLFVNLALVQRGFAQAVTFPPDVRHADAFLAAERDAADAGRGLWADPAVP